MRFHFQGRTRDTYGNTVPNTPITIYVSETTTPAPIFTSYTGGTAVSAAPQINSDSTGFFNFFVDDTVTSTTTLFDILAAGFTYTYVDIFRMSGSTISDASSGADSVWSGYKIQTELDNIADADVDGGWL